MSEGRTILCFASGYDAPPTSKHHVAHLLAQGNVVLWVNYHASRAPTASASDLRHMTAKLRQVCGGLRRVRENLYVLTPLVVPLPGRGWARRLNRWLLVRQIRAALKKLRRGPVELWSFTPDISYCLGAFGEEKVVYYCVDDFASFSGYDREQVLADEADLCRRADLVITTSAALQEAKAPLNPNTLLVQHGVDYQHFARAVEEELPEPAELAAIPRPRLGFFGLIRDWVDLDLLAEAARARPDYHFVLIGDSTVDLAPYRSLANLHFLGRKPYEELPAWCRHLDVGLIPFKVNELTLAVNPIKLREYLAAGLPVVSTALPEVSSCGHEVAVVDSASSFVAAVEKVLAGERAGGGEPWAARRRRSTAMAGETWERKLATIEQGLAASGAAGKKKKLKILVGIAGGGFAYEAHGLLANCPDDVEVVLVTSRYLREQFAPKYEGEPYHFRLRYIPPQRARGVDSLAVTFKRLVPCLWACIHVVRSERPDGVVSVGHALSVPLLVAARLCGVPAVFIDSATRVKRPSFTGRLISWLRLADRFYVQWPQAVSLYRNAKYEGRTV